MCYVLVLVFLFLRWHKKKSKNKQKDKIKKNAELSKVTEFFLYSSLRVFHRSVRVFLWVDILVLLRVFHVISKAMTIGL